MSEPTSDVARIAKAPRPAGRAAAKPGAARRSAALVAIAEAIAPHAPQLLAAHAGNADTLRGGWEAFGSDEAPARAVGDELVGAGLTREAAQLLPTTDRDAMRELLRLENDIALVTPRGGEGLIRFVSDHSRIAVI